MIDQFIYKCFKRGEQKEKAGHCDAAFSLYELANRLKFKQLRWEEEVEDDLCNAVMQTFTSEFISDHQLPINSKIVPVFIVGMPRSGSTLIEQILDTHPAIHGAGEVPHMAKAILAGFADEHIYPEQLPQIGRIGLWKMRKQYMAALCDGAPGAGIVCDKMLVNFLHIGLIAILFPNAKIIHAQRNRDDCLLSCYAKLFNKENLPFTYDRSALVNYHKRYEALMRHWIDALPGWIHTVNYESMVNDHDKTVRELLEYVGVPFDAQCMNFHENTREVKTASRDQVNKPIYTSSIGRGNHFSKYF